MHIYDLEKPKRKLRFTIRRMMLLVLAFALLCLYFGHPITVTYRESRIQRELEERGFTVVSNSIRPQGLRSFVYDMGTRSMFRRITSVNSNGQPVDESICRSLAQCTHLQWIECEHSGLKAEQFSELLESQRVVRMEVSGNPEISDDVFEAAISHPHLMEIDLVGTSVSNEAYRRYLEARKDYSQQHVEYSLSNRISRELQRIGVMSQTLMIPKQDPEAHDRIEQHVVLCMQPIEIQVEACKWARDLSNVCVELLDYELTPEMTASLRELSDLDGLVLIETQSGGSENLLKAIGSLETLEEFYFFGYRLPGKLHELKSLGSLRKLRLPTALDVTDDQITAICNFPDLEVLELDSSAVTEKSEPLFMELKKLTKLRLPEKLSRYLSNKRSRLPLDNSQQLHGPYSKYDLQRAGLLSRPPSKDD